MLENFPSYGYTLIYLTIALLLDILGVCFLFVYVVLQHIYLFIVFVWVSTSTKGKLLEEANELPLGP